MPVVEPRIALPERYRVVRHIANGGMASVWAAEDSLLERLVAIKILSPGFAAETSARHRFMREARAAARVSDHQHVVTIYDIGETASDPPEAFIVMEHFAGGTVSDRLKSDRPVPPATALQWLEEAASALDAAHAADIVHRDVKPGNLLLDERGRLAVGDFGIASIAGEAPVTMTGQVMGTAAYLAPEQASGKPATAASDRYSLAVVAYELLCGRRPFGGDTPVAQMRAHVEAAPPAATGPCSAASGVLAHGLAKAPEDRPGTATAFVEALRRELGSTAEPERLEPTETTRVVAAAPPPAVARAPRPAAAAPPATPRPPRGPGPAPAPRRRSRLPAALAALTAAIALAALGIASTGGDDESPAKADRAAPSEPGPRTATEPSAESKPETSPTTERAEPAADPVALNNEGFAMLPGDPAGAIPKLERSLATFRDAGRTGEIDYAYNLYNLGWALRLAGRPADAIPLLEERLAISDYKRDVVEQELRTAREQAGVAPSGGGDDGSGNGKKPKKRNDG